MGHFRLVVSPCVLSLLQDRDVLSMDPAEQGDNAFDPKACRGRFFLKGLFRDHLDRPLGSPEEAPEFPLERMKAFHPVKREDDAFFRHPGELPQDRFPVRPGVEVMEEAHRKNVVEDARLEGKSPSEIRLDASDVPPSLAILYGPLDHGKGKIARHQPNPRAEQQTREPAVTAGRIKDEDPPVLLPGRSALLF